MKKYTLLIHLGGYILPELSQQLSSVYLIKNILDLPEDLAVIELLEEGRFQEIEKMNLPVDSELLSYYDLVGSECYSIQRLEQESMQEVANTLDVQKKILKSIRQSGSWSLNKR